MPAGTVKLFLVGATGIKDTEIFGKSDPYAILTCGSTKLRSNTAANQGSKPVWNQEFSFFIDDNTTELQIKLFNSNLHKDDEIGSTSISLAKVFTENKLPTTAYHVVRPSGRKQGEMKLSLTFVPKVKPALKSKDSIPGPYSTTTHSSPYVGKEPQPALKHDPLTGPYGYTKTDSIPSSNSVAPAYGSGVGAWVNTTGEGSSKPYPDAYAAGVYPQQRGPDTGTKVPDAFPPSGHPPPFSEHGMPRASSSQYPGQYRVEEITAGVTGIGISASSSDVSSHGGYKPPHYGPPSSAYPPGPSAHGQYPGHIPVPREYPPSSGYPQAGYPPSGNSEYPPSGYAPAGYPPQGAGSAQYGAPSSVGYPGTYPPSNRGYAPPSVYPYPGPS